MKMPQWVRSAFSMKESQTRTLIAINSVGRPVSTPANYKGFSEEAYRKNVIAFKCISLLSKAVSSVNWLIYNQKAGGNPTEVQDFSHPLRILLNRPNPLQSGNAFFESVVGFFCISGNSYIQAVGPGAGGIGVPKELWTMRPDRTKVVPGKNGLPAAFLYSVGQSSVSFPVDFVNGKSSILQIKTFNPNDDWYGMSPVEASAMSVDQHNESSRWNLSLLQNSSVPTGALVCSVTDQNPGGKLTDDQYLKLKSDINEKYSGSRNAGRPMLLEGGLDWKQMGFAPKDMDWIEGKHSSARDIALAFGVPPILLNIPGDSTFANYKEARLAFWEDTVLPTADLIKGELNHWLCPSFGDSVILDYDRDKIEALAPKREAVWSRVQTADWLTINEKREATGYEEMEGGDEILVPMSVTPLPALLDNADDSDDVNDDHPTGDPEEDPTEPQEGDDEGAAEPPTPADPAAADDSGKSAKLFNLKTEKQKRAYIKTVLHMRDALESRFSSQVGGVFRKEGRAIADGLVGIQDAKLAEFTAAHILDKHKSDMRHIIRRNLQSILETFGSEVLKLGKSNNETETKDTSTRFNSFVKNWIDTHSEPQLSNIYGTTLKKVRKAIKDAQSEALDNGDNITDFSDAISDSYDGFSDNRSMLIARTQTTMAANNGSLGAAKSLNTPLSKEWVAVTDDRTREDHIDVNGTVIDLTEKFSVNGNQMDSPGDPSADISELANCRCILTYTRVTAGGGS